MGVRNMKDQNTPTNTLEEILYSYRYDSQSIDEDLVLQQDPSDVEKAHQSNLEEAKQAIEALISQAVNKAVQSIPDKLIGLNVPGTPTLTSEMDKISVQDLRIKIKELETPNQVEGAK